MRTVRHHYWVQLLSGPRTIFSCFARTIVETDDRCLCKFNVCFKPSILELARVKTGPATAMKINRSTVVAGIAFLGICIYIYCKRPGGQRKVQGRKYRIVGLMFRYFFMIVTLFSGRRKNRMQSAVSKCLTAPTRLLIRTNRRAGKCWINVHTLFQCSDSLMARP